MQKLRMTMCGGVNPADDSSEKKGRGEALAACCLRKIFSWCLGGEGNALEGFGTCCARAVL